MSILIEIQKNVPDCTYHVNTSLGHLKDSIEQFDINLDPKYQRDHVWTEEQGSKFVGALIENNKSIPPFWFNWTDNRAKCELIDGKQRVNACLKWLNGEIIAKCPCGIDIWYKDLDVVSIRGINTSVLMSWNFVDLNDLEVMKFYLNLNDGGTVHSKKELDKVRDMIKESKHK